jgi:tyrosine-protein kinase Tec
MELLATFRATMSKKRNCSACKNMSEFLFSFNIHNFVKYVTLIYIFSWYVGDMSRQRAESLLKQNDKEGCFVVRKSSTKGLYTLSLHTKVPQSHVKHYHIKQNARGEFYLSEKHCCETIPDLINYHRHNSGGLACRLKVSPCDRPVPPTAGLSHGSYLLLRH